MKIYTIHKETIKTKKVTTIRCDFCGVVSDSPEMSDITDFRISPGYGSIYDNSTFELDICDNCLTNLLDSKVV